MLVRRRGIATSLRHDSPLIESPWSPYGSEVDVVRVDSRLEEGVGHVHLSEDFTFSAVSKYVIDAG